MPSNQTCTKVYNHLEVYVAGNSSQFATGIGHPARRAYLAQGVFLSSPLFFSMCHGKGNGKPRLYEELKHFYAHGQAPTSPNGPQTSNVKISVEVPCSHCPGTPHPTSSREGLYKSFCNCWPSSNWSYIHLGLST